MKWRGIAKERKGRRGKTREDEVMTRREMERFFSSSSFYESEDQTGKTKRKKLASA